MHTLFSILFGGILLILIARALVETVIGLCQILIGLTLHAIAFMLEALAWCIRVFQSLWRTAFG